MRTNKLVTTEKFTRFKLKNNCNKLLKCELKNEIDKSAVLNLEINQLSDYQSILEASEKIKKTIESSMSSSLLTFAEQIKNVIPTNEINIINEKLSYLSAIASKITFPNIDLKISLLALAKSIEEEYSGENLAYKVKLVEKWADFGWILYPDLTATEIFSNPGSKEEADSIVMNYFNENDMIANLYGIKSNHFIKDFVINDIAMLFKRGSYYSCILLTVVSIEGVLLNYMKHDNIHNGIHTNIKSRNYAKTLFRNISEYEKKYITYLNARNLLSLIARLLENKTGNNWENEPDYVLRDYLCHGMSKKEWEKIDSIKIILLFIEFSYFVEIRLNEQLNQKAIIA